MFASKSGLFLKRQRTESSLVDFYNILVTGYDHHTLFCTICDICEKINGLDVVDAVIVFLDTIIQIRLRDLLFLVFDFSNRFEYWVSKKFFAFFSKIS